MSDGEIIDTFFHFFILGHYDFFLSVLDEHAQYI